MKIRLVKAFTEDPGAGNPAGVVLDADLLLDEQKQKIAADLGFSESAFVEKSDNADFKVRFFSPTQEVDFCGHATIATFHSLVQAGVIKLDADSLTVTQETGIGVLPVTCFVDGKIMMAQKQPEFYDIVNERRETAALLGLKEDNLADLPIQIVATGVKKLIVPAKSLSLLRSITPNFSAIIEDGARRDYSGIAVLTEESFSGNGNLATRNFSPAVGINEDPATGIAAGPLAWYADKYIFGGKKKIIVEQGFDMQAASTLLVDISNGTKVGGYAVQFGEETWLA